MSTPHFRRYHGYDYSRGASFLISISTEPRREVFGSVAGGSMHLSPLGQIALESIRLIPEINEGLALHGHVVMPDHVHFRLYLAPGLGDPLKLLGYAVRGFKRHVAKAHAGGLWQHGYHDHILTSRAFIEAVERYIAMNPLKWELQKNGSRILRIREPLDSARLGPGEYWRGIGDPALLDPARPLASVRISRKCGAAEVDAALARLGAALDKGYALISGFISPGEQKLRDMVLLRPGARFIVALPDIMPYGYKPDSRYLAPIREGRCLVMAHGIEGVDFGRAACLDLNDRIADIACSGEGCATYWRPGEQPFLPRTR